MKVSGLRLPALLFLGILLMQTAWSLALPPFRGADEFDHAYRAAAVARGEWHPQPASVPGGRGELVTVPADIVEAAGPVCSWYDYTEPDNCIPVTEEADGLVTVSSGAARYHPVFYWVVGTAAKSFDGYSALYVMRVVSGMLCAALIALAGWATCLWARTRWPLVAIAVALTPVALYSTSVAAPNGAEMCAGLSVWAALLGLAKPDLPAKVQRQLLMAAIPGAMCLATVRLLGVFWLACIVVCSLACMGRSRMLQLWRDNRAAVLTAIAAVTVSVFGALVWFMLARQTSAREDDGSFSDPVQKSLSFIPRWLVQSIAAYPTPYDRAPFVVYVIGLAIFAVMVVMALRVAPPLARATLAATLFLAVAIPVAATMATYASAGLMWQGRYGLAFAMGIVLISGFILDQRTPLTASPALVTGIAALLLVQHASGVLAVLANERHDSPLRDSAGWASHPWWLVLLLMVSGWATWAVALRMEPRPANARGVGTQPARLSTAGLL